MKPGDFFEQKPPDSLDARILSEAQLVLAENRRQQSRRQWFRWALVPTMAVFTAAVWRFRPQSPQPEQEPLLAEFSDWQDVDEDTFSVLEELELLEDLELLEQLEDT